MFKHIELEMNEDMNQALDDLNEVFVSSTKGKEHPLKDVIQAWSRGKPIQYCGVFDSDWQDWHYATDQVPQFNNPLFDWRITPKTEKLNFINALYFNGIKYWVETIMDHEYSLDLISEKEFVHFIGDWKTVEVEV